MKHIPAWIPRLSYKPAARAGFDAGQDVLRYPMEFVKDGFVRLFGFISRGESASERTPRAFETVEERHRPLVTGARKSATYRKDAGFTERERGGRFDGRTGVYVHW